MAEENRSLQKTENIGTICGQLCESYLAIDDFRTKLLGFLPLATSGLFLLIADPEKANFIEPLLLPIGIFGFAIALGLFCFELYGIRKCTCLIRMGAHIGEQLGDIKGQFATRPLRRSELYQ